MQILTSHKLYFEFTFQTRSIAHASSRLFSGRIPELERAAEIEPTVAYKLKMDSHNLLKGEVFMEVIAEYPAPRSNASSFPTTRLRGCYY